MILWLDVRGGKVKPAISATAAKKPAITANPVANVPKGRNSTAVTPATTNGTTAACIAGLVSHSFMCMILA